MGFRLPVNNNSDYICTIHTHIPGQAAQGARCAVELASISKWATAFSRKSAARDLLAGYLVCGNRAANGFVYSCSAHAGSHGARATGKLSQKNR